MLANTTFYWKGILQSGQITSGVISASNMLLAKAELRRQGIITKKIVKKRTSLFTKYGQSIKPTDITLFTRKLATLNKAGISLSHSFDILEHGVNNQQMKRLLQTLKEDVENGLMLSHALSSHPAFFNPLFCSIVRAGEQSGALDVMLLKLAIYKENIASIKKKINKAMTYPVAVILIAFLVTGGLLTFVIPQFDSLFKNFGADLPMLTQLVIHLSVYFKALWLYVLATIAALVYISLYAYKKTPRFTMAFQRTLIKLPVIGGIIQKACIARFTRTLSITLSAGLPLTEALKSAAGAAGMELYAKATSKVCEEIYQGQSMQRAMQNTQLFPNMVIQFISIGEESGTLDQMLSKIADFYEEDVDTAVNSICSLLEPVIMTILGLLIGGLVVAMYLPILRLGSIV